MIISAPTALYMSILPKIGSVGNVTFTISSNDPPRPVVNPTPLNRGASVRPLPERIYDPLTRRTTYGELVFSVSNGTKSSVPTSTKAFEVGQLLDFDGSEPLGAIDTLNVPDTVDLQQNTNVLDYAAAGLTSEEVKQMQNTAQLQMTDRITNLNEIKTQIADLKIGIQNNQRALNEVAKLISAAQLVFGSDTVVSDKLVARQESLTQQRTDLINSVNVLTAEAQMKYNELLELKEVVR